ncbi:MAG: hypothetical protein GY772_27905 [bacterium]|nr:hypothetical protein [bacterium]
MQSLRDHHFTTPAPIPLDVHIAVTSERPPGTAPAGLTVLSPPELLLAFLQAVAEDLAKDDDDLNAAWRKSMLMTPGFFRMAETPEECHIIATQFREDIVHNCATMRMTAVQRMFDVKATHDWKLSTTGKADTQTIANHYKRIKFAAGSAVVSFEFVDCSLTVLRRLMSLPRCGALVAELEEMGIDNPMDSIYKYHKLLVKAGAPEKVEWALELMVDLYKSGGLRKEAFAIRAITGTPRTGNKGLVDLLVYKRDCLAFLVGEFLDARALPDKDKRALREACASIQVFRGKCGYVFNNKYRKVSRAKKHANGAWWQCPASGRSAPHSLVAWWPCPAP